MQIGATALMADVHSKSNGRRRGKNEHMEYNGILLAGPYWQPRDRRRSLTLVDARRCHSQCVPGHGTDKDKPNVDAHIAS